MLIFFLCAYEEIRHCRGRVSRVRNSLIENASARHRIRSYVIHKTDEEEKRRNDRGEGREGGEEEGERIRK